MNESVKCSSDLKEKIEQQANSLKDQINKLKSNLLQQIDNYEKNKLKNKLKSILRELDNETPLKNETTGNKINELKFAKNEKLENEIANFGTLLLSDEIDKTSIE